MKKEIQEIVKEYYTDYETIPYISEDRDFAAWKKEVSLSKSKLVPKKNMEKTEEGLVAGDIILLWRIAFGTFTTNTVESNYFPKYFEYTYGINGDANLKELLANEYVYIKSFYESLNHTPATVLKNVLKTKKVVGISKMKKDDVHSAIKENFSEEELAEYIDVREYALTDKGAKALDNNQAIVDKHPKKKY
ncbi:MAG: hypothetical protein Q3988_05395 [Gemella sp.]|nr:hypothetical protein [Gemella sp.]